MTEPAPQTSTSTSPQSVAGRVGAAALMLSVSVFLSRILGLLRDVILAYYYGADSGVDAYKASFTIPDWLNYLLAGGALSITFVPMFSSYLHRDDEEGGWRLFSTIATTMGAVFIAFTIAAEISAPELVAWLKPGFRDHPEKLALAVMLTRIVIPAQLAFYFGGLIQSTLFVRGIFWTAAISPLVYNLGIILGGVLLKPFVGIGGFSYGVVIGAVLGPFLLPVWAARRRIRYRWSFSVRDRGFVEYMAITLPLMVGVSLVTVDEWLYQYFASNRDSVIALLDYARKLMMLLFAMLGQATGQAALP